LRDLQAPRDHSCGLLLLSPMFYQMTQERSGLILTGGSISDVLCHM
jgi:hypothetical protein